MNDEEEDFGGGDGADDCDHGQGFPIDPSKGPPKSLRVYGEVWDEFSPSLQNKYKNYLTKACIFELQGHGFYAQAVMSTCKMANGMFDVVHKVYPIKIDVENKKFLMIGANGPRLIQEVMKVENVDKFIDLVIAAIVQEPQAEIKFQMAEGDPDNDNWWRGKNPNDPQSSPDWWKKGGENPLGDPI